MRPTPILFYFPFNKTLTGGPRTLLTLLELIDRSKFSPLVVTQKPSPLVDELAKRNVEVLIYPLPEILSLEERQVLRYGWTKKLISFFHLIRYNKYLIKVVKSRDIRLIWARNIKGVLLVGFAASLTRNTLIWDIGLGEKFEGFVKVLHFIALNLSDHVITQGKSQHQVMFGSILSRWYNKKLNYILPGISQDRIKAISQLNIVQCSSHYNILSIGTIGPRKNQMMLAAATKSLITNYPSVRVNFVGPVVDQAYYERLRLYIDQEKLTDNIFFLGWRDDIPELMVKSHVLVLCSFNEGIPRVVHEAMHAQLPVIATTVGGIPDAIIHGKTGFLVEPNDLHSLTACLSCLIDDPTLAREVGKKAQAFAQENFTYQAYYNKYEQLFANIIRKRAK